MEYPEDRFQYLRDAAAGYLTARDRIPSGYDRLETYESSRLKLMEHFGASEDDWADWRWQLGHRIHNVKTLLVVLNLSPQRQKDIAEASRLVRWSVSPYFAALMDPDQEEDPLRMQSIPSAAEISDTRGSLDPMAEEATTPCPLVSRRYPDRLIIKVTNACAMFCRHCQRRRLICTQDAHASTEDLEQALDYVAANHEIRDVLITGGDPLTMTDDRIAWIMSRLDAIPHVEIKRIGSRVPVTMPQRITESLCRVLQVHPPVYLNTQFNHPLEVTAETAAACNRLADAGVVLGNQSVLLKGINDDPYIIRKLNHELLKMRVRPYYLFQAKPVRGTTHFVTTIDKGLEIMADLRGRTSGLAIPSYVFNVPGGYGKVPLLPEYIVNRDDQSYVLRTWEGRLVTVPNGPPVEGTVGGGASHVCSEA